MKKIMLGLALSSGLILTAVSCKSPAAKVENAQDNVKEAQSDLDEANKNYIVEVEKFRKASNDSIQANEKSIQEFKERVEKEKRADRAKYEKEIARLEEKNTDMKKRMDDFKADSKEKWEDFKTAFNHDMFELHQSFRKLTGE